MLPGYISYPADTAAVKKHDESTVNTMYVPESSCKMTSSWDTAKCKWTHDASTLGGTRLQGELRWRRGVVARDSSRKKKRLSGSAFKDKL